MLYYGWSLYSGRLIYHEKFLLSNYYSKNRCLCSYNFVVYWTIIDSNLIHLGGLAFASLVMLMFHFHFYESTSDKNIFNKIDFILQLFLVFISIIKFFVISGVN